MDLHTNLLERMASISPGVRFHLEGQQWLQHIDEDEITPQLLVNECFSLMIDESYEFGLEFFCTRDELCDSLYHIDKVLLVFEVFYPTPLYRSLTEDEGLRTRITTAVVEGAAEPGISSIIDILYYLAMEHPTAAGIFEDSWLFLHDKLVSNATFNDYVKSIMETDNTSFQAPIDDEDVTEYLNYVKQMIDTLMKAVDHLHHNNLLSDSDANIQYNRITLLKTTAIDPSTADTYVWMHKTQTDPTPIEQALKARYSQQFCATVPFYPEYYKIQPQPLTSTDVVSLVLGCLIETTSKSIFTSHVDGLLPFITDHNGDIITPLQQLSQELAFSLIERFYP